MSEKNDLAEARTEWAEDRTDWAEDRTVLANERTFAGWMRTGMAAIAIALGLRALFGSFEPTWLPKTVATVFVATGIVIFWAAERNARSTLDRLNANASEPQTGKRMTVVAAILSIGALATGVILWFL